MKRRRIIIISVAGTCLIIFGILCLLASGIFQDRQEKNVLVDFGSGGTSFCGPSYYWDWEVINLDLEPENIPEDKLEDALEDKFTLEVNDYSFAYAVKNGNGETKSPQTSILSFTVTSKEQMPPEAESISLFRHESLQDLRQTFSFIHRFFSCQIWNKIQIYINRQSWKVPELLHQALFY